MSLVGGIFVIVGILMALICVIGAFIPESLFARKTWLIMSGVSLIAAVVGFLL